jgi:hypothetical protein
MSVPLFIGWMNGFKDSCGNKTRNVVYNEILIEYYIIGLAATAVKQRRPIKTPLIYHSRMSAFESDIYPPPFSFVLGLIMINSKVISTRPSVGPDGGLMGLNTVPSRICLRRCVRVMQQRLRTVRRSRSVQKEPYHSEVSKIASGKRKGPEVGKPSYTR